MLLVLSHVCYESLSLRSKRVRSYLMPTQEIGPAGVRQYSDDTLLRRVNLYLQKAVETQSIQQTMHSRKTARCNSIKSCASSFIPFKRKGATAFFI